MSSFYARDARKYYKNLRDTCPENFQAFINFDAQVFQKEGALQRKIKELIAIAVAHTTQCPYCIETHVKNASKAGATEEEIAEAIFIAAAIRAGGAFAHSTIAMATLEELKSQSTEDK